jgi:hypothetical protein
MEKNKSMQVVKDQDKAPMVNLAAWEDEVLADDETSDKPKQSTKSGKAEQMESKAYGFKSFFGFFNDEEVPRKQSLEFGKEPLKMKGSEQGDLQINFDAEPIQNPSQEDSVRESDDMSEIFLSLSGHLLTKETIQENKYREEEMFQIFEDPENLIVSEKYAKNPS